MKAKKSFLTTLITVLISVILIGAAAGAGVWLYKKYKPVGEADFKYSVGNEITISTSDDRTSLKGHAYVGGNDVGTSIRFVFTSDSACAINLYANLATEKDNITPLNSMQILLNGEFADNVSNTLVPALGWEEFSRCYLCSIGLQKGENVIELVSVQDGVYNISGIVISGI